MTTWKDIQRHLGGLAIDGVPGPRTAAEVCRAFNLEAGPTASASWKKVQAFLNIAVDGIAGPQTLGAVIRQLSRQDATDAAAPSDLDPYGLARTYIGTTEIPGRRHNPIIVRWSRTFVSWVNDDETAWCSSFVNAMARECGYEHSGKLNARSWLDVGLPVSLAEARPGDVVVFWRGKRHSWTGHVAFFEHFNKKRQLIYALGGNQGNEVNITAYPRTRLLGIRRIRPLARLEGRTSIAV